MSEQVSPKYRHRIREITEHIRPLVDDARNLTLEIEEPNRYYEARFKLTQYISNPEVWAMLNTVQPGAASNYAIHNLGPERMDWLREFREHLKKAVNQ